MGNSRMRWCAFGGMIKDSVGRVERVAGDCLEIRYYEGQMYPPEYWDANYVRRFETPEEAAAFAFVRSHEYSQEEYVRMFKSQWFPSVVFDESVFRQHVERFDRELAPKTRRSARTRV